MASLTDFIPPTHEVELDGKKWKLTRINFRGFADMETWMEMLPMDQAKRVLDKHVEFNISDEFKAKLEGLQSHEREAIIAHTKETMLRVNESERRMILERAWDECHAGRSSIFANPQFMMSARGLAYMLWLAIRQNHPEFKTWESVADRFAASDLKTIQDAVDLAGGWMKRNPTPAATPSESNAA